MAKLWVVKGKTSKLVRIFIQDSSSTTGAGLTGLTSGSSGLVCSRSRDDDGNAGATSITLSAGTRGTWSSGGFVEKDSTKQPGVYEFGVPNAALATGSESVLIEFLGATNMAPLPLEIELTGVDNQDATKFGMTRVVANADQLAGQTVTAAAGVTFPGSVASPTNITAGVITTVTTVTNQLTAAAIATGVWQDTTAGDFTTASSIGKSLFTSGNAPGAASGLALVGSNVGAATSVSGAVGSVTGAVGSVTGAVGSVGAGGIAAASFAANAIDNAALATSAANEIADALLDRANAIETGYTLRQAVRLTAAAVAAKLSGAATTTVTIRALDDSADRITATVDANGNRSAVTLTP